MPPLLITAANAAEQIREARLRAADCREFHGPGCLPNRYPYGLTHGAIASTQILPRIDRAEWPERIKDLADRNLYTLTRGKLAPHDQGRTNYCWAHGSVRAVEILRVFEGQSPIILSAESIAVPVTGGRNRGGSPDEALQRLRTHGACDQSYWPLNDLDHDNAKDGWIAEAENHIVLSWLEAENFDDQMTWALHNIPGAIGLRWWGHLVCQVEAIQLGRGAFGLGFDNSWSATYGDNGHAQLDEEHATADLGAFAPLSETFSAT